MKKVTHKEKLLRMDRSYAWRRDTHGKKLWIEKKYIRRQITPKRGLYAKRVQIHAEQSYAQKKFIRKEVTHWQQ